MLDPQPLITTDAARREWAAFYGAIARGYDAEYELGLNTERVEDDVREASPAALERLRALAEQAERCAPRKNFDIERQARRNLSPAEEERWSAAVHEQTLTLVRRMHVDRRGFISGPGPQTIPLQVWRARRSRSMLLVQRRVRPRERAVRRRVAVTRRRARSPGQRRSCDPDPPARGRLAVSGRWPARHSSASFLPMQCARGVPA